MYSVKFPNAAFYDRWILLPPVSQFRKLDSNEHELIFNKTYNYSIHQI